MTGSGSGVLLEPGPRGAQAPRVLWVPDYVSSSGEEACELAEMAGLGLDEWQQLSLIHMLGERADGKWAAFEAGVLVSRQNGKGGILEARELAGLYLLPEKLIIHSAHEFSTALEAFRRLLQLIEETPDLDRQVMRVSNAHGKEGIELRDGSRIRFRTRTSGGGRGLSGDSLVLDEAMILRATSHGALVPTLAARPNSQIIYTGTAVDQEIHEHGQVFARVRARGLAGGDPSLMWAEWSVDAEKPDDVTPEMARDPEMWAQANPALGIRITHEHIANEQRSLNPRTFAVERLSVGDWPPVDDTGQGVIDAAAWAALIDEDSQIDEDLCLAYDLKPDRTLAAIVAAGRRADGRIHVEVIEHKRGTGWLAARLADLDADHDPDEISCDAKGPAASLLPDLEQLEVNVQTRNATELAQACGAFYDLVVNDGLRHLGTPELEAAVKGAAKRPLGDAWAWARKSSAVDISPLVAASLAVWSVLQNEGRQPLVAWR